MTTHAIAAEDHEQRCSDAVQAMIERVTQEWLGEPRFKHVTDRRAINEGPCAEFAEEVQARLADDHAIAAEMVHSDEIADEYGYDFAGYHCFLQVGDRYFDAEMPEGTFDPWCIPFMRRAKFLVDLDRETNDNQPVSEEGNS